MICLASPAKKRSDNTNKKADPANKPNPHSCFAQAVLNLSNLFYHFFHFHARVCADPQQIKALGQARHVNHNAIAGDGAVEDSGSRDGDEADVAQAFPLQSELVTNRVGGDQQGVVLRCGFLDA